MRRKLLFRIGYMLFIAAFAIVAIPNFIGARMTPSQNSCVNNLRQLDGAKQQWQLENRKTTNDIATLSEIAPYLKLPLVCPAGGTYIVGRVGEPPKCSFGRSHVLP